MSNPNDINLKDDGEAGLEWHPGVDGPRIDVAAVGDVITITCHLRSDAEERSAERIAEHDGAQGLANDIDVQLAGGDPVDDADIVQSAVSALNWNFNVPEGRIRVLATKGFLTIEGDVDWHYQQRAAEDAVRYLRGVRGLSNQVVVNAHADAGEVKSNIEAALRHSAAVDEKCVFIEMSDGSVTLRGQVRSWAEHDDALSAAWAAPGVMKVVDHLSITLSISA